MMETKEKGKPKTVEPKVREGGLAKAAFGGALLGASAGTGMTKKEIIEFLYRPRDENEKKEKTLGKVFEIRVLDLISKGFTSGILDAIEDDEKTLEGMRHGCAPIQSEGLKAIIRTSDDPEIIKRVMRIGGLTSCGCCRKEMQYSFMFLQIGPEIPSYLHYPGRLFCSSMFEEFGIDGFITLSLRMRSELKDSATADEKFCRMIALFLEAVKTETPILFELVHRRKAKILAGVRAKLSEEVERLRGFARLKPREQDMVAVAGQVMLELAAPERFQELISATREMRACESLLTKIDQL